MNGPIRRVAAVVMVMFLALMLNATYSFVFRTGELNAHQANRRVRDAEFGANRGSILVGNSPIASSKPVDDQYRFQRTYPQGTAYAHVTGFYSFIYGGTGLEQSYSPQLAGTDDAQFLSGFLNQATGERPQGASLETTLDARAQKAALAGLGDKPGAVVAIDYTTGAVKALVSTPTFDPNVLASHDLKATQAAYDKLSSDPDRPLANRAAREIYQPGSTFKLVVAAAALESGLTPDTMVESPSTLRLPQSTFELSGNCGGEQISLRQALQVSCNTAFAQIGSRLGADALREQAKRFGFGTPVLPELNGVASRFPEKPDAAQTMLSSIGAYEVAATPVQMAMVAGGIANNGVVMDPYLVSQVRGADLAVLSRHNPRPRSTALSVQNARGLADMMVATVDNGTGRRAQISGVRVGGKTGTAVTGGDRTPYAWFVAFADDPAVAVAVFVQDSGAGNDTTGGRYAAPIAKSVIESLR